MVLKRMAKPAVMRSNYRPDRDIVPCRGVSEHQIRELCDERGARALAAELDAWWHKLGFTQVHHTPVLTTGRRGDLWAVRSNLHNGLPPVTQRMMDHAVA